MFQMDFTKDEWIREIDANGREAEKEFPFAVEISDYPMEVYGPLREDAGRDTKYLCIKGEVERAANETIYRYALAKNLQITCASLKEKKLRYIFFPQFEGEYDFTYASNYFAIDLVFSNGQRLSEQKHKTRDGFLIDALSQGRSRTIVARQWNCIDIDLSALAELDEALTIEGIEMVLAVEGKEAIEEGILTPFAKEMPDSSREAFHTVAQKDLEKARIHIYLEEICIERQEDSLAKAPVDFVNILRGTHDNRGFSRGLAIPAVAVPQGAHFFCPATTRAQHDDYHTFYDYHAKDFIGINISHQPSVWIGDRATFQFAATSDGVKTNDEYSRAAAYSHKKEIAKPYLYEIEGLGKPASQVKISLVPSMHGAIIRFAFDASAKEKRVILDSFRASGTDGNLEIPKENAKEFSARICDVDGGMQAMYMVGKFSETWESAEKTAPMQAGLVFGQELEVIELRIALSFIDEKTARETLARDLEGKSFEEIKEEARALWEEQLSVLSVSEELSYARKEQVYSNLYRLFLYPTTMHETEDAKYRSPYAEPGEEDSIRKGKFYYNNGFWDTFRTAWPAYALFTPKLAFDLADGTIEHWRASSWIPRWVAPGGRDCMVGTSADIVMADLYEKDLFTDEKLLKEAWQSTRVDGLQVNENTTNGGRQSAEHAIFDGYTAFETHEGLSWTLEGCLNDYGLSALAKANGAEDEALYFAHRARAHQRLFWKDEEGRGWYRGLTRDGNVASEAYGEPFDPSAWGGSYTETDAWNMLGTAVHDSQELMRLHGGAENLCKRLDELMTWPGIFSVGAYGGVIHEMLEARDVKLGRLGVSNQPSHHLPSLYHVCQRPDRASLVTRDLVSRLQVGGNFGQGYVGDEDNGEMSAFFLFGLLGIYPLAVGIPVYTLTAPLLPKATIHMDNGVHLEIKTIGNCENMPYIEAVHWNGEEIQDSFIAHEQLAKGGTLIFSLSEQPTEWGKASVFPSLDDYIGDAPCWIDALDFSGSWRLDGARLQDDSTLDALFDNNSKSACTFESEGEAFFIDFEFEKETKVHALTLTSAEDYVQAPKAVQFFTADSPDGPYNFVLERELRFSAKQETVPLCLENPRGSRYYRLGFIVSKDSKHCSLAEVELLKDWEGEKERESLI